MRQCKRGKRQEARGKRQEASFFLASCFLLLVSTCFVFAEDKAIIDSAQPITITSNNMEARKKDNLVIFKGDVAVQQKDYILYSNELHIYYAEAQEIKEMIAMGNVKMVQLNKVATGEKAVYNRETRVVVITGNPQVEQDCDVVKGDKITIFLDEDKSLIEGGGNNRVMAVVHPKNEKTKVKCK
ncbi:MAG: lipopolysaccharide transport periplasmic protein LptA [Deltaproteobacteria bacterium]|nr:lipopolysaccharide transport periplasmic protein LptA [Deltaproteobacteria bacterium]